MIKLVIFDFDDTLTDNTILDHQAFKHPCRFLNLKIPEFNEMIKLRKKGCTAKQIIKKYNRNVDKNLIEDL